MDKEIIIANLALESAVRKYKIDAILRQKPSFEAPAEACLKALFITERLSEAVLIRYLGLAAQEFEVVIAELLGQFYVYRSGPDLMLTQKGKQAIDPSAEGQQRSITSAVFAFEATAFAEAPRGRAKIWMHRIPVTEVREDGRPEAAEAFREGFFSWRARERDGKSNDALARVSNVAPLGRETTVIKAPVVLAPTSNAAFIDVSRIELGSLASAARREACAQRFRETVMMTLSPKDGAAALSWIESELMPIPGTPALDPVGWARRARSGDLSAQDKTFLVSETAPSIIARGGLSPEGEVGGDDSIASMAKLVLWAPPEGEAWRLDADIDAATQQLLRDIKADDDEGEVGLVAAVFRLRKGAESDLKKILSIEQKAEPFGAALLSTSVSREAFPLAPGIDEDLPQALELVLRPGIWALAIAHFWTERSPIPIPVGVFTTDIKHVDRVAAVFRNKINAATEKDWLTPGGHSGYARVARSVANELHSLGD